jgi:hypothetical protein
MIDHRKYVSPKDIVEREMVTRNSVLGYLEDHSIFIFIFVIFQPATPDAQPYRIQG